MKKIAIWVVIILLSVYPILYLGIPYLLNKNDYSKIITESIKKQTGLNIIVHNYKLKAAPNLDLSLQAQEIQAFYPDGKQFLNMQKPEVNISTLYLLKKEIKIDSVKAKEIQVSTKLLKNGKTTLQEYLQKNIKPANTDYTFSKTLPKIKVDKYIIKIKDEKSGQKFKLAGNDFKITQNLNFSYINAGTKGNFYCFDKKYVSYDLKIAIPKKFFKDTQNIVFEIPFNDLCKYEFKADVFADLKADSEKEYFDPKFLDLSGKIDIDNFSLRLGGIKLPPSYFHINLKNNKASVVSKFYTSLDESADIVADIKVKKPYEIDLKCKCKKAQISNLQKLAIPLFDILKIKNNIAEFHANGVISSDFTVKTDFKSLQSSGSLKIQDANISHKSIPLKITNVNALVDFSNDAVKIKQSDILINGQPVQIVGKIDQNAYGDILVSAKNLDINHIMNAFPILKPAKNLVINSGKLSFSAKLKGKLAQAEPQINALVSDFTAQEKINRIKISIKEILVDAKTNKKDYSGIITINNLLCSAKNIPNSTNSITANIISAKFDNKDLIINPAKINMGNAKLTLSGNIKNYITEPQVQIETGGTIDTGLVKSFMPSQSGFKIYNNGYLPVKAKIISDGKLTKADVKILANPNNFITPIHIKNFKNTNSLTHILLKTDGRDLDLEDFTLYYSPSINSLVKDVNLLRLKKAITADGRIENFTSNNPNIKDLNLKVTDNLSIEIPEFKNSRTDFNANLKINGTALNPLINGNLALSNLEIPEYFIKAQNAQIELNKSFINAKINNLKIKSMDLSLETILPSDFITSKKVNYVKIDSQYVDMDYLMALMPLLNESPYSPGIVFPYTINSGKLNVNSFKMGSIKAQNITADISVQKNLLHLNNLFSNAYGGKAAGKITYNFPYSSIQAEIQGRGLDAASAAKDFLPKNQQISGRLNFDSSVTMSGTNFEQQMKTLTGRADILINNGHLGPLGRFEHFLYAQNLLSQRLIYANLNSAKQAVKPKDTGYVTYLKGMIKFNRGHAHLNPVLTAGPKMSMYITGVINLLNNEADLVILGKVSSEVSSSMGILGTMTIKDFLDEHTKYGQGAAKLFNFCNSEIPELDISKIPQLNPDYRYQTKNFRVVITGDTESIKAVKSFTWINPPGAGKIVPDKSEEGQSEAKPIVQTPTQPEKTQKPQIQPVVQSRPMVKQPQTQPNFLDNIPDNFK